jgi:hypothetical protein
MHQPSPAQALFWAGQPTWWLPFFWVCLFDVPVFSFLNYFFSF